MKLQPPCPSASSLALISAINTTSIPVRIELRQPILRKFRRLVRENVQTGPILLARVANELLLLDGAYRLEAARVEGRTQIEAYIEDCTYEQAVERLIAVHVKTPLALAPVDRKAHLVLAIKTFGAHRSARAIAALCDVSPGRVIRLRRCLNETPVMVLGRDNKAYCSKRGSMAHEPTLQELWQQVCEVGDALHTKICADAVLLARANSGPALDGDTEQGIRKRASALFKLWALYRDQRGGVEPSNIAAAA